MPRTATIERNTKETQITLTSEAVASLMHTVQGKIISLRGVNIILDTDVAALYGVETKRINEAVKNNPDKFPPDYMFTVTPDELAILRSKISTANLPAKSRSLPHAFTEKGLYMLATILKSRTAIHTTFAIIETFSAVRGLKRELLDLHRETDSEKQQVKMEHFGNVLSEIVMPDLETTETESSLELNFIIGKIKHTVRRVKRNE